MSADDGTEEHTMGVTERIGAFCFCLFFVAVLVMLAVTVADITIPMP